MSRDWLPSRIDIKGQTHFLVSDTFGVATYSSADSWVSFSPHTTDRDLCFKYTNEHQPILFSDTSDVLFQCSVCEMALLGMLTKAATAGFYDARDWPKYLLTWPKICEIRMARIKEFGGANINEKYWEPYLVCDSCAEYLRHNPARKKP